MMISNVLNGWMDGWTWQQQSLDSISVKAPLGENDGS